MDDARKLLELIVGELVGLIGRFAEALPWPAQLMESSLYVATCALLFISVSAVHRLIFWLLRRRLDQQREKTGSEDLWIIISQAVVQPLKLAFWVLGTYLSSLPLLLFLERQNQTYSVRLLVERFVDLGLFAALFWLFYRFIDVCENRLRVWAGATKSHWQDLVIPLIVKTLRVIIPVVAVIAGLPLLGLPPAYNAMVTKTSSLFILGAVSWLLFQIVGIGEHFILRHYDVAGADSLRARQIYTQVSILKRTLHVVIIVLTFAAGLMLFDPVRNLGASVLASAGVIGIIVGFAAQRTIANLFAGFQLALTQPIRINDVVIAENEWGQNRGNHADLRGRADLGFAAAHRAAELFHRTPVSKLDARRSRHPGHGISLHRLYHSGRRCSRRIETHRRPIEELGRQSLRLTSHQCHGAYPRTTRAGERCRQHQSVGSQM
jgi:small-conductance mechanosensitive channel